MRRPKESHESTSLYQEADHLEAQYKSACWELWQAQRRLRDLEAKLDQVHAGNVLRNAARHLQPAH